MNVIIAVLSFLSIAIGLIAEIYFVASFVRKQETAKLIAVIGHYVMSVKEQEPVKVSSEKLTSEGWYEEYINLKELLNQVPVSDVRYLKELEEAIGLIKLIEPLLKDGGSSFG